MEDKHQDIQRPRAAHIAPRNRNGLSTDGLQAESSEIIIAAAGVHGFFRFPNQLPERQRKGFLAFEPGLLYPFFLAPTRGDVVMPRILRGSPSPVLPKYNQPLPSSPVGRDRDRQEDGRGVAGPTFLSPNTGASNHKHGKPKGSADTRSDSELMKAKDFARAFGLADSFYKGARIIIAGSEPRLMAPESCNLTPPVRLVMICFGDGDFNLGSGFCVKLEAYDPETQWRQLRSEWSRRRGRTWMRNKLGLLGYRVKRVQRAKIRLHELPSNPDDNFVVSYRARDTKSEIERLVQLIEADKRFAIPYLGYDKDNSEDGPCHYDEDGQFRFGCILNSDNHPDYMPDPCCDVKGYENLLRDLTQLEILLRYPDYFRNPKLAGGGWWNKIPCKVIHTDGDLKTKYKSCRDTGLPHVEWEGFHIVEGWALDATSVVPPALATSLFIVVMISRLVFGDWATAWTVAGSLAGFVAVGLMWFQRELGR